MSAMSEAAIVVVIEIIILTASGFLVLRHRNGRTGSELVIRFFAYFVVINILLVLISFVIDKIVLLSDQG